MRVGYSILREINRGEFLPTEKDYGLRTREFENFIKFLENEGYLERVLRLDDYFSIKPARLTNKGHELLNDNKKYEESYPERKDLIKWVQVEKDLYSNGAVDE